MPKPDPAKERYWRAVIADSDASGLNRAEYCRQRGINNIQLRNWMKRLKQRDTLAAKAQSAGQSAADIRGKRKMRKKRRAAAYAAVDSNIQATFSADKAERSMEFAEVRLIEPDRRTAIKEDEAGSLEIILPTGLRLRLVSGFPLGLLSSVLTLLENR